VQGIYQATGRGFGFLIPEEGEDYFIPPRCDGGAWNGDRVAVLPDRTEAARGERRTGRVVEVLEDGEESSLVYSALCRSPLLREESLLSYVGTGSVGLAVWRQGAMDLSCNLTIGFLKLSEMLRGQEELTARFYRVLEEYVENYFQRVALRLDGQTFSRILLSGRQLDSIAALCGGREEKGALVEPMPSNQRTLRL